jgi:hypothetical protein
LRVPLPRGSSTKPVGYEDDWRGRFEQQVAGYFTVNETFDVGCDTVSPVSDLYESPFAFTGTILRVMVDISETTFEDLAAQHEMHARLALATQ